MSLRVVFVAGGLALFGFTAPARADPCEAPLPNQVGVQFSGTVRYVADGDSLCVGKIADPHAWIEVRLADFNAPELHEDRGVQGKAALERIALHREVTCTTERGRSGRVISFDRVIARCRVGSQPIDDMLRQARAPEGGN
ncbi:nuclease [Aquamicrobium lusatiense]|uniref:thermonuclease family protein n=1 Tax=Aquamicrobium lusatiense TaxID=89772 RepID=UPI002453FDE7|nr:nuclease [Aquamicrobium lusatiense]MDH4993170.1 nuclease [Aquamicrobium lusatiense]